MNTLNTLTVKKELPVFTTILDNHQELNAYLKQVITEHRQRHPETNESNVKAWHSSWKSHEENPKFKPIVDLILSACEFVSQGYFEQKMQFKCFNMWAMQYEKGEYAVRHSHYPSDFACAYYVDVEPGCSPIIFEGDLKVVPENGMLVLFPAMLHHEVPPTDARRMVISANIDKHYC
jgi:hypothetical protein